ncbi:hypothetical protein, partial [Pseudomonas aeruginosa]|uniref:hypothetical protein n=1 Tax=Pseudomonas aeruginosa TaxID=287 RepID=UPI0039691E84
RVTVSHIDEDDKTTCIESHKTKQRVTPGDIVAYNLDALDVVKLVHKIDDTVPVELIQECLDCGAVTATTPTRTIHVLAS